MRGGADLAVFHDYVPPPSGGGNQFVRALTGELEARGLVVERNRISGGTRACLFNSFNFDARRLRRFARKDVRLVHRVDGPIGVYRGWDDGTDGRIEMSTARSRTPRSSSPAGASSDMASWGSNCAPRR